MKTRSLPAVPDAHAVREEAVQSLIANMGIGRAAVFIRTSLSGRTDYVRTRDQLFVGQTVDGLSARIREARRKTNS